MKTKRRVVFALLIFAVYEVLGWLVAAQFASGPEFWLFGFVLTALGLTALIVYLSVSRLLLKQAQPKQDISLAAASGKSPIAISAFDTAPILELIREAGRRLAHSRTLTNKRGKALLTDLPLYLIAGPAGAGKTAAFLAAGLSPELLGGQVQRESTILPTSLCNLWYASDAIFAEAGGQFFSDGPHQWEALLQQLCGGGKPFIRQGWTGRGKRTNVRGVILFCDVSPFLGIPDPARISSLARKVQERMQIVGDVLGSSFPVYTIFSKADLVPHFNDFFYRIPEEESRQIFGCSLSVSNGPGADEVYAEAHTKRLSDSFNRLYAQLAGKRPRLLAREPEKTRRPGVYEFPREVKRIRDSLVQFLVEAFRPNPLQPGPLLRGFYFTGIQQVPAAAAMSDLADGPQTVKARSLDATVLFQANLRGAEPAVTQGAGKSEEPLKSRLSFVSDLFHKVILRDPLGRAAAEKNVRNEKRNRIVAVAAAIASGLFICCFFVSWWGNSNLLSSIGRAAPIALPRPGGASPSRADLKSMDELRQSLELLLKYNRTGPPWHLRWGLYSGGRVLPRTYDTYFQLFQQYFLTKTEGVFQARLGGLTSRNSGASYDSAYDTLKAYRATTSGACPADASFLAPVFFRAWEDGRILDPEVSQLADQQVQFYATELARRNPYRIEESAGLVADGREFLNGFGGVDRVVRGLIEDANQAPRKTIRVVDLAPKFRQVLTGRGEMQAAFTLDGWTYVKQRLREPGQLSLGESCVLGAGAQPAARLDGPQIAAQLTNVYIQSYIQAWKSFIAGTAVQPFHSTAEAARNLDILADNRSPLLAVLFLVAQNTTLLAPNTPAAETPAVNAHGLSARFLAIGAAKNRRSAVDSADHTVDIEAELARVFQPVHQVIKTSNLDRLIDDPNRDFMNALGDMQQAMAELQNQSGPNPDPALQQAAQHAAEKGLESVRQIAQRFNITGSEGVDTEVRRLLESPFRSSMKLIARDAPGVVPDAPKIGGDKLAGAAKVLCAKLASLEHTFPFDPQSDVDATSEQVGAVFAPPAGALFSFEQQLGKLVILQGRHWVQNPQMPEPRLAPQLLQLLDRLTVISEGLFRDGTPKMRMAYTITPLPIVGTESITLEIDGQKLTAAAGEAQSKTFDWPGATGNQAVLVRVKAGANIPFASYDGMWGIFRMLNDADPRAPGSPAVTLSKVRRGHGRAESVLDQNDKPIQVRLQLNGPANGPNVFEQNLFQIRCPAKFLE